MGSRIAVVDKYDTGFNYSKIFDFEFSIYFLVDKQTSSKVSKKHVTLDLAILDSYDYVILVGADVCRVTGQLSSGVSSLQGCLINNKYIPLTSPFSCKIKPENKPEFDLAVSKIHDIISNKPTSVDTNKVIIEEEQEAYDYLSNVLEKAKKGDITYTAMDTETSALYPRDGYIVCMSLSYKRYEGVCIVSDAVSDRVSELLQSIIDNTKYTVFHNAKFDIAMMEYHYGLKFGKFHDTMLMHYILDERRGTHGLKDLAAKLTPFGDYDSGLDAWRIDYCRKNKLKREDFNYSMFPIEVLGPYACMDTIATLELFEQFKDKIVDSPILWAYQNLLIAGTKLFIEIQNNGVPFSREALEKAQNTLNRQINRYKKYIYSTDAVKKFEELANVKLNLNSVVQLRQVLFNVLMLSPTGIMTDKGEHSLNEEALTILAEQHSLPKAILKARKLLKIKNTYIDKVLTSLDRDSRLRTNFNLHTTTSGRASSSGKLNMQQLPRDNKTVKKCIVAGKGKKIVSVDLSTAEMYVVSVLSKDKNLQKVFKDLRSGSGADFHSAIAHMVFDLPCEPKEVKAQYPKLRQAAKAVSFGILYGAGPQKVADSAEVSLDRAREVIKSYYDKFHKLSDWLKKEKENISNLGYTYSIFSRKRRLPNVKSPDKQIASHEVRSGINFLVQSVASDINLLAAVDSQKDVLTKGLDAKIFGLVHDSILAEVSEKDMDAYCDILRKNIEKDRGCNISGCPILYDIEIGDTYAF